jgi:excisionase family DNA binding protein
METRTMDLQRGTPPAELHRRTRRETPKPVSTTVDDACRITGLGRTKVYELIGQGKLKTATIGRRRLVIYASIIALLGDGA